MVKIIWAAVVADALTEPQRPAAAAASDHSQR